MSLITSTARAGGQGKQKRGGANQSCRVQPSSRSVSRLQYIFDYLSFLSWRIPFYGSRNLGPGKLVLSAKTADQSHRYGCQRTPGLRPCPWSPATPPRTGRREAKPHPAEQSGSDVMQERAGLLVLFPLSCSSSLVPSLPSPFTPRSRGTAASGVEEKME